MLMKAEVVVWLMALAGGVRIAQDVDSYIAFH